MSSLLALRMRMTSTHPARVWSLQETLRRAPGYASTSIRCCVAESLDRGVAELSRRAGRSVVYGPGWEHRWRAGRVLANFSVWFEFVETRCMKARDGGDWLRAQMTCAADACTCAPVSYKVNKAGPLPCRCWGMYSLPVASKHEHARTPVLCRPRPRP